MTPAALERIRDLPYHGTITERKRLAQEIRNELIDYRKTADWSASSDKQLQRVHNKWLQLLSLENLEQVSS